MGDDQERPHRSARGELRGEEGRDQHGLEHPGEHCNDRGEEKRKVRHPGRCDDHVISTALSTLASIATTEAKKNGKFVIPGVVMITTRQKKATKAGKREIFGKMVMVKAKPAKTIVKAFPAKALGRVLRASESVASPRGGSAC